MSTSYILWTIVVLHYIRKSKCIRTLKNIRKKIHLEQNFLHSKICSQHFKKKPLRFANKFTTQRKNVDQSI